MVNGLKALINYRPGLLFAISLWVLLNLADWVITVYHLSLGGTEGNYFIAGANNMFFLFLKLLPIGVGLLLWRLNKTHWLLALSVGMAVVVYWNLTCLLLA